MNTQYRIKDNHSYAMTNIARIGIHKQMGDQWAIFTKKFTVKSLPTFAATRFSAVGVCGLYINGEFIAADTGRYAGRVSYAECTSRIRLGENEIKLVLGGHYYQTANDEMRKRRGTQFSVVAAELHLEGEDKLSLVTDESWCCESDDGQTKPQVISAVTKNEYDRMWLSAALWKEDRPTAIPPEVAEVAEGYVEYVSKPKKTHAYPSEILYTNMERVGDDLVSVEPRSHVMYRFDKLYCGYSEVICDAEEDGEVELRFDYTTSPDDLEFETPNHNIVAKRLALKAPVKKGENRLFFIHRRAAMFVKVLFNVKVTLHSFGFRLDLINHDTQGYFHSSDPLLDKMWEVGKYTIHITKHQEYESCPRNEMKYFSGDGILAALIDAYAFGDGDLTVSSLSYTEMGSNVGLIHDVMQKNVGLWEYPAWRIVHAYNHYFYFNDTHLVREHFDELAICLDWMIGKVAPSGLIYQYPTFSGAFCNTNSSTDYTQSPDRLGEKPHVNALYYKSLLCMAEFADIVGDERGKLWREMAKQVKSAINARLWSEKDGAYLDTYSPTHIPQDGNALCVLFGIAEGDRADTVFKTLCKTNWTPFGSTVSSEPSAHKFGGNATVSPLMNTYEAEARFLCGDRDGAIDLIRRCFGGMIQKGAETFWEYCPSNDAPKPPYFTNCHGWSAGCTYLLSAYALGIKPLKAGYEEVSFRPSVDLPYFEGVVPSPKGLIAVNCKDADGKKAYTLAIPRGMILKTEISETASLTIIEYDA